MLGPMARYTGYAVGFRGLVRRLLERKEFDIDLRATKENVPDGTEPELLELLKRGRSHGQLGVITGFPPWIGHLDTRYKVLYSMYEADDLPFDWKSYVERANEVWVPTVFCARVFGQYNRRIRILPWGIDERVFCRGRGGKRGCNDEFTFGAVGVQSPRKGTDVLVRAFGLAFGGRAGVSLKIKTRDTKHLPPINNPQIEVIDCDWPEDRLVTFLRDIDCLVAASRGEGVCALPGTEIRTEQGMVPIDDLSIGDSVVTHENRFRPITETMSRNYSGRVYGIRRNHTLVRDWYTEEHPILVVRKKFGEKKEWVPAKDILLSDYVVTPKAFVTKDIESVKLAEYGDCKTTVQETLFGESKAIPIGHNQFGGTWIADDRPSWNNDLELTPDVLKLIGLYIAEGFSGDNYIRWAFHWDETAEQDHVKRVMAEAIGATHYKEQWRDRHRYTVNFDIGIPARFFGRMFGRKSYLKHIPECLMLLPPEKQKHLILGMWLGDGCVDKCYSYSTVSETLAYQMQELLRRAGVIASVHHRKKEVYRDEYSVRCKGRTADEFFNSIGITGRKQGSRKPQETTWQDGDNFYVPIHSIECEEYEGPVYNIEVEEDHSYCSQFIVHNCMPPLQAAFCGTPSIATNWGGSADYIDDAGIWGLNIKGLSRADRIGAVGAHWAEPDEKHLALLMRRMVEERPEVKGSYDRWTLASMADHFTDYAKYSWQAANR